MSLSEDEDLHILPPLICSNPRQKIEPEKIDIDRLGRRRSKNVWESAKAFRLCEAKLLMEPKEPPTRFPIVLMWIPTQLYFNLDEQPIIKNVWIMNRSKRSVYVQCNGLLNEEARLGASWITGPHLRYIIAPGMKFMFFIKATPRLSAPIPSTTIGLKLTASHFRDIGKEYFSLPIVVNFLKYEDPLQGEGSTEIRS